MALTITATLNGVALSAGLYMETTVLLIYIATLSTGGGQIEREFRMKDMETCATAVSNAQIKVPTGGDAESTVSIFCVNGKNQ